MIIFIYYLFIYWFIYILIVCICICQDSVISMHCWAFFFDLLSICLPSVPCSLGRLSSRGSRSTFRCIANSYIMQLPNLYYQRFITTYFIFISLACHRSSFCASRRCAALWTVSKISCGGWQTAARAKYLAILWLQLSLSASRRTTTEKPTPRNLSNISFVCPYIHTSIKTYTNYFSNFFSCPVPITAVPALKLHTKCPCPLLILFNYIKSASAFWNFFGPGAKDLW